MIGVAFCLLMAGVSSAYALFPKHENTIVGAALVLFVPLVITAVGLTTH